MKSFIVLLIIFCLCQGQPKPTTKRPSKPSTKPPKDTGCPKGWNMLRDTGHCFHVSGNSDTYEKARKSCESRKSQLVTPIACGKQIDLPELQRGKCGAGQNCEEFWIGIDNLKGDKWKTSNGFEIDKNRKCQQWAKNFPKENEGNCAIMSYKENKKKGVWKNINCNKKFKYACIKCPIDFDYVPEINQCLIFNPKLANWSVARESCAKFKKGVQLLTIRDQTKQDAVARYVKSVMTRKESGKCLYKEWTHGEKIVWLGAQTTDPNKCKTPFVWKPLGAANKPFTYAYWIPKAPNCGFKMENCAILTTSPDLNFGWEDLWCDAPLCSVCEF